MQSHVKANTDLAELTREKEERTNKLTNQKDKLANEYNLLSSDIASLKEAIFGNKN